MSMPLLFFFFFNDTATTEIYTLSLHDALPIFRRTGQSCRRPQWCRGPGLSARTQRHFARCLCSGASARSEEHTSELQSQSNLVCRLLLEKKKKKKNTPEKTAQLSTLIQHVAR